MIASKRGDGGVTSKFLGLGGLVALWESYEVKKMAAYNCLPTNQLSIHFRQRNGIPLAKWLWTRFSVFGELFVEFHGSVRGACHAEVRVSL
jgi:hypothetical protein